MPVCFPSRRSVRTGFAIAAASLFCLLLVSVETPPAVQDASGAERPQRRVERLFPDCYRLSWADEELKREDARPYWVPTADELALQARRVTDTMSLLLNDDILAFYGSPISKRMGLLGVHPLPELDRMLGEWAAAYDSVNGERGIKRAFYIIYGTVWPKGDIGILKDAILTQYIEYALAHDILVFVDHQIGKYPVDVALRKILPWLRYPNVHLALDPEWRTTKPMEEIGSVTAAELNEAQRMMEEYIVDHGFPGERMLVIHQFNWRMIQNREQVRSDFARVRLVHCADGFGHPAIKAQSYRMNAQAQNLPVKGFKLFFKSDVPTAGYDEPLMSPADVMGMQPRPYIVMYQ